MIDQDHLQIGNTVYCELLSNAGIGVTATITKVGRKYTYTTNPNLIIDNSTFSTKPHKFGMGMHRVFKSQKDCEEYKKSTHFIASVRYEVSQKDLSLAQARMLNKELNLGIEE